MYDVLVVGGGHAGIEAALAPARRGFRVGLITLDINHIGSMPCNPSIGGPAKGVVVREIDALGGEMGKAADATYLQMKMLNTKKGPGVRCLRCQSDKIEYSKYMIDVLKRENNITLIEDMAVELIVENGVCIGITTEKNQKIYSKTTILTTGTYLNGKILRGHDFSLEGPDGQRAAYGLSDSLRKNGIEIRRFKTGTPARVDKKSIDFLKFEVQPGDDLHTSFSYKNKKTKTNIPCYLGYTSLDMHNYIREHITEAPLYSGAIKGIGPRYCPSIEDKVMRFADKERHQLFLEPESASTDEIYVQGISSSMPSYVQRNMYKLIPGFEHVKIMRFAYAIEYDCINPNQLLPSLEFKNLSGLFSGGQFNGSSGYEEAAAQGIIAGINAAQKIKGLEPLILDRSEAYIGVLIDDLVTKESHEPYRMMTSRCEYRLVLRQDNADLRLSEKGYELGLISEERIQKVREKKKLIEEEIERLNNSYVGTKENVQELLRRYNSSELTSGVTLSSLVKRPELNYDVLKEIDVNRPDLPSEICEQVNIQLKYDGYIATEMTQIRQFRKLEKKLLPEDLDYKTVANLRIEAQEKLNKIKPRSLGQASRISGVSPADITVLLIYLEKNK